MSSSFDDSVADPVYASVVEDSPPIYVSGEGISSDQPEFSSIPPEHMASDGSVLPPLSEMQPEEGFPLREWRRQNALRLEEKERMEKELLNQIIDEADEYKINFHSKKKLTCDNNIAANRESEKEYLAGRDRFHAEANKSYWKAIAELIPKEVPVIETRGAKKDHDKKPSVVVIQGPKPGKPTDLSRMRQILIKLKHETPLHLKPSPPPPAAMDVKTDVTPAAAGTSAKAVAVA